MKIAFAIKALGNPGGGAERVLVDVASGLSGRGHAVTIISSDAEGTPSYYRLDDSVHRINLGIGSVMGKSGFFEVARRMLGFRRAVLKLNPDAVVAFMHSTYVPVGLALAGTGLPMVASEHIGPEHYKRHRMEGTLLLFTPLFARRITVVSRQIMSSFGWWLRRRMVVVPNPVLVSGSLRPTREVGGPARIKTLLTIGRLAPQKNQKCLIAAFARISGRFPDWKLRIVGDGELRPVLEAQVRELGLMDRVEMHGSVSDVSQEYFGAELFVLPSTYESFGLATAEALLHGLPAIGFANCPGTNDLIRHQENGLLVTGSDSEQALAEALAALMGNQDERRRLAQTSRSHLARDYGLEGVLDQWEAVLRDVCA